MKIFNRIKGAYGEERAKDYLVANKYKIVATNFSCKLGEIDIIATKNKTIIAIEVKMRETKAFGEPYEAVDFRKQEKIRRTMEYFLLANPKYKNFNIQFDVISILGESLEHIKEAF